MDGREWRVEITPYPLLMHSEKILALIPARGGSKGLPRKNVLEAGGKPLIAWTIVAAQQSSYIDDVVLSSDDDEIIATALAWNCNVPFRRPDILASDTATSMDVVLHALDHLPGYDYVVLLQPTSPMRTSAHIDAAFELLKTSGAPCCVSVCEVDQSPYWMYTIDTAGKLNALMPSETRVTRRQDLPAVYTLNGAIYIARVDWLRKSKTFSSPDTVAYVMERRDSIDIDTIQDFTAFCSLIEV